MAQNIDKKPTPSNFDGFVTGHTVQGSHFARWAREADFHLGYNLHQVCNTYLNDVTASLALTGSDTHIQYWKSPYAKVGVLELELNAQVVTSSLRTCWINAVLPSGATWIGSSSFDSTITASLRELHYPHTNQGNIPVFQAFVDVSGVTTASIVDFHLQITNSNGTTSSLGHGIARMAFNEVPLAYSYVSTTASTEPGIDLNWTQPNQFILEGNVTASYGLDRVINQLDLSRAKMRKQFQLGTHTDQSRLWYGQTGTDVNLTYQMRSTGDKRYIYFKTRDLYNTGSVTTTTWTWRVWYKTDTSGTLGSPDYNITLQHSPSGSATVTAGNLQLTPSVNWTTATGSLTLPTNGTGSVVTAYLTTKIPAASRRLDIHSIAFFENES